MKKVLMLGLLLCCISIQARCQKSISEVYAIYLYTFTKYVDNPVKSGDYKISIIGDSKLFQEMQKFNGATTPSGQTITIAEANEPEDVKDSRIVFLASHKSSKLEEVKNLSNSALIVTERNGLTDQGSCINFINRGNKVSFQISEASCQAQKLKVSSTLFALSK